MVETVNDEKNVQQQQLFYSIILSTQIKKNVKVYLLKFYSYFTSYVVINSKESM